MEWRFSDWKESSIVEIILRDPEEDETDVYLTQTKIPSSEKKEKIEFGWREYIFGGINKILGYPYKDWSSLIIVFYRTDQTLDKRMPMQRPKFIIKERPVLRIKHWVSSLSSFCQ